MLKYCNMIEIKKQITVTELMKVIKTSNSCVKGQGNGSIRAEPKQEGGNK